ncbi:MAG: (2Fe-2S)-binding protein [Rhodoplanes sp.]
MLELKEGKRHPVDFVLNGKPTRALAEPRMLLSDFLRQELGCAEIHVGCEHGVCGACTILIDGVPARSCLTLAVQAADRNIQTVHSLEAEDGKLSDLQQAFRRHHALQCGYCTPGILISAERFLSSKANPSEQEVREMLSGHICRCTGYVGIVEAILETARTRAGARS